MQETKDPTPEVVAHLPPVSNWQALKNAIRGTEGDKEGEWVLVDLDDIIVHIMVPTTRAYYNLEQLWGEAEGRRSHIKPNTP